MTMEFSYNVEFPHFEKQAKAIMLAATIIRSAKHSATGSVGFLLMGEIRNFMESEGDGTWPKTHPLTRFYKNKYEVNGKWRRRRLLKHKGAYNWLAKFARYVVFGKPDNEKLMMGFGKFSARDMKKGRSARLDRKLQRIAKRVQLGNRIRITPRMRRKLGIAWREMSKRGHVSKRDTHANSLHVPKRPVMSPVFARNRSKIFPLLQEKFWDSVKRKWGGK